MHLAVAKVRQFRPRSKPERYTSLEWMAGDFFNAQFIIHNAQFIIHNA